MLAVSIPFRGFVADQMRDNLESAQYVIDCLGYDTKQYDGEVPLMVDVWGMWSTPSLPSLSCPLDPE